MSADARAQAEEMLRRGRRLAMGGTFLVAVSLAVQLGQEGPLADDNLLITGPVAFLGAMLSGWILRPSAALAMATAIVSVLWTLGVSQTGSTHTDEVLLFAIPFSAAAGIVVGHVRHWPGGIAAAVSIVLVGLAVGVGMSDWPIPFAIVHLAIVIALPNIPLPSTLPSRTPPSR